VLNTLTVFEGLGEADRCKAEGLCGMPDIVCPKHQAHLTCPTEIDNVYPPKPERVADLTRTVEDGERLLMGLRWQWARSCERERPAIEEAAAAVKARITLLQSAPASQLALKLLIGEAVSA
jgi:hypothetical protein